MYNIISLLALRKAEKEEGKRAREKVLKKLDLDKVCSPYYVNLNMFSKLLVLQMILVTSQLERKQALGLPLENRAAKPPLPSIQEEKVYISFKFYVETQGMLGNVVELDSVLIAEFLAC